MSKTTVTSTPTYYAPSTSDAVVTTWLPLTTIYPNHGNCASNFWLNKDDIWAWLPDCPIRTFGTPCLPPAATLSYLAVQSYLPNDVYNIGPFAGCPASYTPMATSTISGSSSLTICCPTFYDMVTLTGGDILCTSAATETVINGMDRYATSLTVTWSASTDTDSSSPTTATVTGYTSWMSLVTLTAGQSVKAYPISGWNLASSAASAATDGSTCVDDDPAISTGVIAGLAVLGVWAVGGTAAAVVSGILLRRTRRRRRALGPKYEAAPGFAPPEQSDGCVSRREMHEMVGPPSEMTEGPGQRMELPGSG